MRSLPTSSSLVELHDCLPWSCSLIGGSFALQQFTRADWVPGNIDVFVATPTEEAFLTRRDLFVRVMQTRNPRCMLMLSETRTNPRRFFDASIVATSVLHFNTLSLPVKLWAVAVPDTAMSLASHVVQICDLPACLYYTVDEAHGRTYHVPGHAVDAVLQRRVAATDTTSDRRRTYEARGYTFVQ